VESDLHAQIQKILITPLEPPVVKFSMALPEHSFHGKEPNSSEKSVPIPLFNEKKAKLPCGVRTACPDAKNITTVEPPVVKFSMALPEHSFHAKEPNSNEKSLPIPLLNEKKAKCGVRTFCPDAKDITTVEPPAVQFSVALPKRSLRV
jgi:hypothetical protein